MRGLFHPELDGCASHVTFIFLPDEHMGVRGKSKISFREIFARFRPAGKLKLNISTVCQDANRLTVAYAKPHGGGQPIFRIWLSVGNLPDIQMQCVVHGRRTGLADIPFGEMTIDRHACQAVNQRPCPKHQIIKIEI